MKKGNSFFISEQKKKKKGGIFYSKKVIEHFKNPHNTGQIKNPDGFGSVGNILCGDILWLYLKIGKNKKGKEIIKSIKFETYGCIAAIATSSLITDLVKGKTLEQVLKIDQQKIIKTLEGLPPTKLHCSSLAIDAISEAIYNYLTKKKRPLPEELKKRHQRIEKEKEEIEKRKKQEQEKKNF